MSSSSRSRAMCCWGDDLGEFLWVAEDQRDANRQFPGERRWQGPDGGLGGLEFGNWAGPDDRSSRDTGGFHRYGMAFKCQLRRARRVLQEGRSLLVRRLRWSLRPLQKTFCLAVEQGHPAVTLWRRIWTGLPHAQL